jgi:hypothetical protein
LIAWNTDYYPVSHPRSQSRCVDIAGNRDGVNPLWIEHFSWLRAGTFTSDKPSYAQYQATDYPFDNQGFLYSHYALPSFPSTTAAITDVQARTNPSRPEVSIPNFIFELKDIPSMLYRKGLDHIEKRSTNSAVDFNFGWDLLIRDLLSLADFTEQVDKRVQELERLHSVKGLRRQRTTFEQSWAGQLTGVPFQTAWSFSIGGRVTYQQTSRQWGSVHWIPSAPSLGDGSALAQQARFLVHGWDASPGALASILWNALPWSWFSDYFFNLGDYLDSQRNGAGAIAELGCVMEHSRTEQHQIVDVAVTYPGFVNASPGSFVYETKSRVLATAGLSTTVPFLSARQLVTLSSIAISLGQG